MDEFQPAPKGEGQTSDGPDYTTSPDALAPGLLALVEGINFNEDGANTRFLHIPPDPIGAVGTGHLVSVVNSSIEWRTKAGVQQNSQALASFFASLSPATVTFDP